jgi:glutamyl-tRNA reductase
MTSRLVIVGINHRTAPVETRERVAVPTDALEDVVRSVKSLAGVEEAMMVATCNRVEVYAAASDPDSYVLRSTCVCGAVRLRTP